MGLLDRQGHLHGLGRAGGQIDQTPDRWPVLIQLGEQQQILDQQSHPYGFLLDPGHQPDQLLPGRRLTLLQRELGQPPDRGQWRPQFMAGVRAVPHRPPSQQGPSSLG